MFTLDQHDSPGESRRGGHQEDCHPFQTTEIVRRPLSKNRRHIQQHAQNETPFKEASISVATFW